MIENAFQFAYYKGSLNQFWLDVQKHVKDGKREDVEVYLFSTLGHLYGFSFSCVGVKTMASLGLTLLEKRVVNPSAGSHLKLVR